MRFSLKTLLVLFAILASGCTALLYPTKYWTTGFYSASLSMIVVGLLAAVVSCGLTRAYWFGFAICGGAYFLAAFYGDLEPNYRNEYTCRLITSQLLLSIDEWLNQLRPQRGSHFSFTNLDVTLPIGHAVLTVIAGLLGGEVAEWLYRRHEPAGDA